VPNNIFIHTLHLPIHIKASSISYIQMEQLKSKQTKAKSLISLFNHTAPDAQFSPFLQAKTIAEEMAKILAN